MQNTNLNVAPYYDDFDASKNYMKVLYRPGRTVQARELNQMQSYLQAQIDRFGKHMFEDGSLVIPGGVSVTTDQKGIEFSLDPGYTMRQLETLAQPIFLRSLDGVVARVLKINPIQDTLDRSLFLEYIESGSNGEVTSFKEDDSLSVFIKEQNGDERVVARMNVTKKIVGIWAKSKEGVYFVRGHFIVTNKEDVLVSQDRENIDVLVGYEVKEEIVTEIQDKTLYSNAQGEPNFKGSGASRLKISLTLTHKPINYSQNRNFLEIVRIEDGVIQENIDNTTYSLIEKSIARRTFETNGNFTVEAFGAQVKEHLKQNADDHNGVYLREKGGDESKFVVQMKPGIGYAEGYRIETIGLENVSLDKARDTMFENNVVTAAIYGPYILIQNVKSFPNITLGERIRLLDASSAAIGTAVVRASRRESDNVFRLYVFDFKFNAGKTFNDAKKVDFQNPSNLFTADLVSNVIFDSSKDTMLFELPYSGIASVKSELGNSVTYSVLETMTTTLSPTGTGTVSLGSGEIAEAINNFEYVVTLTGAANDGTHLTPTDVLTLSGSPVGRIINISAGSAYANKLIKIIAPVIKTSVVERVKTLRLNTMNVVFNDENVKRLQHTDVLRIVSIKNITDVMNPVDLTSQFVLDNGQRDGWYDIGSIRVMSGSKLRIDAVEIVYEYFQHSPGDYFSVDSYGDLDRALIPSHNNKSLTDFFDFRQDKDINGDFVSTGRAPKPGTSIRSSVSFYLPRIDSIYLTADGQFLSERGVPSQTPVAPTVPGNSMKLYDVRIPAYTKNVRDVILSFIENKRYTMRDIGKLETRIENVEYYTSLSMLEGKVNSMQIIDPATGNNRFKNGFAVDGFQDFSLSDTGSSDYRASIDHISGVLRASFVLNDIDMTSLVSSELKSDDSQHYVLPYTEKTLISQPVATRTININPYAVFTWSGIVQLSPSEDFWRDVVYLQPIQNYVTVNNRGNAREGSFDTIVGTNTSTTETRTGNRIDKTTSTVQTNQTTSTVFTSDVVNKEVADRMVSEEVVHFMRSIDIEFTAKSMRPFTRVYAFFDGVNVSAYCGPTVGSLGQALITDKHGHVSGVFRVPNSKSLSFETGASTFRLTDRSDDDRVEVSTSCETVFKSGGITETRQKENLQTTTLGVKSSTSTTSTVISSSTQTRYVDPIAQTFMVPGNNGNLITKVGVRFATKASTIPVSMEIRLVENGMPTSSIVAGGVKTLNPDQVTTSDNSSAITYFKFDRPLFLESNKEYAIVLLAETQEYNVYISELGGNIIGQNAALGKQPYLGVLFHSSNGTTWTPAQTQDLTFEVVGCKFATGVEKSVVLGNVAPKALPTTYNAISTTSGSNVYRLYMRSHGLRVGDSFTLSGTEGGNGVTSLLLNETHTVTQVNSIDHVSFIVDNAIANVTGTVGGENIMVESNLTFSSIFNFIDSIIFNKTNAKYEISYRKQDTRAMTPFYAFDPQGDVFVEDLGMIARENDLQIRVTFSTDTPDLSPILYRRSMGSVLKVNRISNDVSNAAYSYVTKDIKFDNPSSTSKIFIGARLPASSTMKVFYKLFVTSDEDISNKEWTEIQPSSPLTNSDINVMEYVYDLDNVGSFVGYKIKVVFLGDDACRTPIMTDFRSIALA